MKNRLIDKELVEKVKKMPCLACGKRDGVAHHIKSVATGGPDIEENLMPLCEKHHTGTSVGIHWKGINDFLEGKPYVKEWLYEKGWKKCPRGGWYNQIVNDIIKKYSKM